MADVTATFDGVRVLLEESSRGAVLARGAATGTVRLRFVDRPATDDLVLTLARDGCSCTRATDDVASELTVFISTQEVAGLLDAEQATAQPLRVAGRRELLLSLASILRPPRSPLSTQLRGDL